MLVSSGSIEEKIEDIFFSSLADGVDSVSSPSPHRSLQSCLVISEQIIGVQAGQEALKANATATAETRRA